MRVQPHLPSRPLTATVMVSDGLAWCACKAANNPAPPAPRIRTSVCSRRMANGATHTPSRERWRSVTSTRFHTERGECGRPLRPRPGIDGGVNTAAVAVHRHAQRSKVAHPETPQALRMQIVEIDRFDRLDPGRLQGR